MSQSNGSVSIDLNATPVGLIVFDDSLRINAYNDAAAKIFGYSTTELLYKSVDVLLPVSVRPFHDKLVASFIEKSKNRVIGDDSTRRTFQGVAKDGSHLFLRIGITMLDTDNANQDRFVVSILDETELKSLNDQLTEKNRCLERNVADLNELRSQHQHFSHVISHELKSPLHIINSILELLKDTHFTNLQRAEFLGELSRQFDSLTGDIKVLIDFSDLQNEKLTPSIEPTNLYDLLNRCLMQMDPYGSSIKVVSRLEYEIPRDISLHLDRLRIQSIVGGLVANSIKHGLASAISIYAFLQKVEAQNYLVIEVDDNGSGISGPLRDNLFIPFANRDTRQSRGSGGLGISLSLYKAYLEAMKGSLELIVSIPNVRTMFKICLPVSISDTQEMPMYVDQPDQEKPLFSVNILVVDDDSIITKLIGLRLKRLGAFVLSASNGQEAIDMLNRRSDIHFNLILMDLDMPILNGYEATKRIRLMPRYQKTPIYAVTAAPEQCAFPKAISAGMDACYGKPFDPAVLFSKVGPTEIKT